MLRDDRLIDILSHIISMLAASEAIRNCRNYGLQLSHMYALCKTRYRLMNIRLCITCCGAKLKKDISD